MRIAPSPTQNHLLAAVPAAEFARLASALEPVPMLLGATLYEPGGQLEHAYFPVSAIVSLHYVMASGASAAVAGSMARATAARRAVRSSGFKAGLQSKAGSLGS